ncbi:hypothetical protein [Saccharopolyspora sp. CA-218241]|uniref:hypothetical protein n=1 Tax=Saccharopolyspora sp. CA-218241 TaxID=3240027 RepID=UPI003D989BE6
MVAPASPEEAPHISALRRAAEGGFRFRPLPGPPGAEITALYAERHGLGIVETIAVRDIGEAVATRTRACDYPTGDPLWQRIGAVADVVLELLDLPPHDQPGAPVRCHRPTTSLWLPGDLC